MLETPQKITTTDEVKMSDTGGQSAGNERLAWLAGIVDGEGSICLAKRPTNAGIRYVPLVTITNTHQPTIEHISWILKGHNIGYHVIPFQSKRFQNAKRTYTVHVAGMKRVDAFLTLMYPWLFTKFLQATIVKRFICHRLTLDNQRAPYGDEEFSMFDELKSLNAFGSSETTRAPLIA